MVLLSGRVFPTPMQSEVLSFLWLGRAADPVAAAGKTRTYPLRFAVGAAVELRTISSGRMRYSMAGWGPASRLPAR